MPHSSGGGSHGGGSHGGGSHHSHSGGRGSGYSTSRSYFPGARRYRYRHHGTDRYIYSDRDPAKQFSPLRLLIGLFYLPFIGVAIFLIGTPFKSMLGLNKPADTEIIIKDEAEVLSGNTELMKSLDAFYEKSGIVPAVITVNESVWKNRGDLENYAYNRYLAEFDDEMHWLIVFSAPEDEENWSFEGIQGNDTDPILTENVTARFNSTLVLNFNNEDMSIEKAIADSFDSITPGLKKPGIKAYLPQLAPGLFVLAFVSFHAYFMLGLNELKYRKAVYDPDPNEATQMNDYARTMMAAPGGQFLASQSGLLPYMNNNGMNTQQGYQNLNMPYQNGMNDQQGYSTPQQNSIGGAPAGLKVCSYCGNTYRKDESCCPICGGR